MRAAVSTSAFCVISKPFCSARSAINIAVNFTLFAFSPRSGPRGQGEKQPIGHSPQPISRSNVGAAWSRPTFAPWWSDSKTSPARHWDLINEPSFSNPRVIFKGNVPNGDPAEVAAWHKWLRQKYDGDLESLADAWSVPVDKLGGFDAMPLLRPAI